MTDTTETTETTSQSTESTQTDNADSVSTTETTEPSSTNETEVTDTKEVQQESQEDLKETQEQTHTELLAVTEKFSEELKKALNGTLSEDDLKAIEAKGLSKKDFNLIASSLKAQQETNHKEILDSVGGETSFKAIVSFAESTFSGEDLDNIKDIIQSNLVVGKLLLQGIKEQMEEKNGIRPSMTISPSGSNDGKPSYSREQIVDAMTSFKYKNDVNFRMEIDQARKRLKM